ncbi:MAG: DUF554 domain-containing protein [Firmicutes bacterium]|nr:DUF554 domain-containing protein [Bacillota bacterium]
MNTVAVLIGGGIGLLFKKGIPTRIIDSVMKMMGAVVLSMGITGIFKGENSLVLLVSIVLGTIVGELVDIDTRVTKLGKRIETKIGTGADGFTQGFVTATLLFCIGAMAIVGSIQAGMRGDNSTLFAKSVLDGVSSVMLAATLGAGVLASAACILIFEGGIAMLAGFLAPVLTSAMIAEMTCVGSLMIIVLGMNVMGITDYKVANCLPALLFAPFITELFSHIGMG